MDVSKPQELDVLWKDFQVSGIILLGTLFLFLGGGPVNSLLTVILMGEDLQKSNFKFF